MPIAAGGQCSDEGGGGRIDGTRRASRFHFVWQQDAPAPGQKSGHLPDVAISYSKEACEWGGKEGPVSASLHNPNLKAHPGLVGGWVILSQPTVLKPCQQGLPNRPSKAASHLPVDQLNALRD